MFLSTALFADHLAHALKVAPLAQRSSIAPYERELYRLTMYHCLNRAYEAVAQMPLRSALRSRAVVLLDAACSVCRSNLQETV